MRKLIALFLTLAGLTFGQTLLVTEPISDDGTVVVYPKISTQAALDAVEQDLLAQISEKVDVVNGSSTNQTLEGTVSLTNGVFTVYNGTDKIVVNGDQIGVYNTLGQTVRINSDGADFKYSALDASWGYRVGGQEFAFLDRDTGQVRMYMTTEDNQDEFYGFKRLEFDDLTTMTTSPFPQISILESKDMTDGLLLERQSCFVENNGIDTIYFETDKIGGGDLVAIFDSEQHTLDCTTGAGTGGRAQIALTVGTDASPVQNYVYLTDGGATATLNVSTSFPMGEFCMLGSVLLQSYATTVADGPLLLQRWSDPVDHGGRGKPAYTSERVRREGAWLEEGCVVSVDINNQVSTTAGMIYQHHRQSYAAVTAPATLYVVNHNSGAYTKITDLDDIDADASGNGFVNNDYFNVWVGASVGSGDDGVNRLFLFLSTDAYSNTQGDQAIADSSGFEDTSIPADLRTDIVPLARIRLQRDNAGGWDSAIVEDKRFPTLAGRTGGGGGSTATSADQVSTLTASFDTLLSATDVEVQTALETLDDHTHSNLTDAVSVSAGAGDAGKLIELDVDGNVDATMINDADVDHDSTTGFVANEHVDHSSVSITGASASGISGGGDITASRELSLDIIGMTLLGAPFGANDSFAIYDNDAGVHKRAGWQALKGDISHTEISDIGSNTHADIDTHISSTANPHTVTKAQVGLADVANTLHNFVGTTAPTPNEDSGDGYTVGSYWYDTTNDKAYVCLDNTLTSAVWVDTTQSGGGGSGEANTASSQGTGTSIFYQKTGVDLQFNAIKSENSLLTVALDGVTHDVELTVNEGTIDHDNLAGKDIAGTGVTYGHVNDTAQTFVGNKTFSGKVIVDDVTDATPTDGSIQTDGGISADKGLYVGGEGDLLGGDFGFKEYSYTGVANAGVIHSLNVASNYIGIFDVYITINEGSGTHYYRGYNRIMVDNYNGTPTQTGNQEEFRARTSTSMGITTSVTGSGVDIVYDAVSTTASINLKIKETYVQIP